MNHRIEQLIARYPKLSVCATDIQAAFEMLRNCFMQGGRILIAGNGGSAADAEHWSAELLKGFENRRELSPEQKQRLPEPLANALQNALPAIPLTGFTALHTAFSNDVNSSAALAQLTWALAAAGDLLVVLSTSGDSENICQALEVAAAKRVQSLALTGENGGRAANLASLSIRAPEQQTRLAQELHLPIYHALCLMLEDAFFGNLPE